MPHSWDGMYTTAFLVRGFFYVFVLVNTELPAHQED